MKHQLVFKKLFIKYFYLIIIIFKGEIINSVSSDIQEIKTVIKHTISMGIRSITQV